MLSLKRSFSICKTPVIVTFFMIFGLLACSLPFQSQEAGDGDTVPGEEGEEPPSFDVSSEEEEDGERVPPGIPAFANLNVSITVLQEETIGPVLQLTVDDDSDFITTLYWTDSGADKIQRARIDDFGVMDLVTEGLEDPSGILVDLERGKIVWTDAGTNHLQRADLDGSRVEDLVTEGANAPFGISLEPIHPTLFWSNAETFNLTRTDVNGGIPMPAIAGPLNSANGVAVDEDHNRIYWVDQDRIRSATLNGLNLETIVSDLDQPHALAIDPGAGKLYWSEKGRIRRSNVDGSEIQDLVFHLQGPIHGLALDLEMDKMYWTNFELGTIQRANLDGAEIEEVITGLDAPSGLAIQTGESFLRVPCGLVFTPGDDNLQRLMVIQEDVAAVPAGGTATLVPYVVCIDSFRGIPELDASYQIGTIAEDDLNKLANCICDRRLADEEDDPMGYLGQMFGLQMSVWQVSNSLQEEELREEMAEAEGALGGFAEMAELFDAFSEAMSSYTEWLEECDIEVTP